MPKTKTSREEILRQTWRVLHRQGYASTSLQQLAEAAGLGKAGLLHHFGSKKGLMVAVIQYAKDWYTLKVTALLQQPLPLEERLRQFLEKHRQLCEIDGAGCFFANTVLETGARGEFSALVGDFHAEWISATAHLLEEKFSEEEARERAYRLFIDYEGSVILFKLYQESSHLDRFVERAIESLQLPIRPAG